MNGYVYILSNESLPGLIKIGITNRDPFARAAELRTTGVPTPFVVVAALLVTDPAGTEARLHQTLSADRVDQGREFFRTPIPTAVSLLLTSAGEHLPTGAHAAASAPKATTDDQVQQALTHLQPGEHFNLPLAETLLTACAKQGSAVAHFHLGWLICEHQKLHLKPMLAKATKHFERAVAADLPDGYFGLAWLGKSEYVAGYLSREADPEQKKQRAIELFLRALWQARNLPDVYCTQPFIELIPEIHAGMNDGKYYRSPSFELNSRQYPRFLEYATRASKYGLVTFTPTPSDLAQISKRDSSLSHWSCPIPDPKVVESNRWMTEFEARRKAQTTN